MKRSIFFVGLIIFGFFSACWAQEINLEKIVVTPYRYGEDISKAASSVTVISQKDIKSSNAQKTIDVLRSVSGLVVRDWYGNATKAAVDIRGFGEQANLNVLVLVDGRRANEVDLSGVDWTQIPLDQIERIEIIRGGSGSVLYGDNASSGVINIITKGGKGKPRVDFLAQYGSYDLNMQKASVAGAQENLSYFLSAGREGTHGYRNNSFHKSEDFASKLGYEISNEFSLHFSSGYHNASYGLPASLNQTVIDQHGRRYARNGDDHANDNDYYFVLGSKNEFGDLGDFDIDFSFRRKKVDTFLLTSTPNPFNPTYKNKIDTFGFTPKYTLDKNILGHNNKIILGMDYYRSDYSSDNFNHSDILQNFTDINKISLAGYFQNHFSILKNLVLVGGYRYERAKFEFDYHDNAGGNPDIDKNIRPNKKAFNAGLAYDYQKDSILFFNISRSFRFPAVDEFTYNDASWQQQLNTNLKPQSSTNYELGIRHKLTENFKADLSLFLMKVKDELYYNSTGGPLGFGQNENYDKTIHRGLESSLEMKINGNILIFGNYAFTKAFFDGGQYNKNDIPLVPRHKASIGLRFLLPKGITLNLLTNYVGERYFLNDQANAFSRLNSYMTTDMNIIYRFNDLTVSMGVNNILNKKYSEYAGVTVSNGVKFYYPSPARNFNLKLEYKF